MNKNTVKAPVPTNSRIEYLGIWGFALVWLKVFAITAVIILILKYVFKVPFSF